MAAALATTMDAEAFDLTVTSANLLRASTRVRAFVGQQISPGTSVVTLRGPVSRLPQRPARSIVSVTDVDGDVLPADQYRLLPGGLVQIYARHTEGSFPSTGYPRGRDWDLYTVVYDHGFETVPDEVVEIVCTVAARLGNTDPTVASGVQQEQSGSTSQTFGWDAWKATSSLTSEEKAVLSRLFPKIPGPAVVMRP